MNVTVEAAGACRKKLQIEFAADEVEKEYGDLLKSFNRVARIPGFRPGRAPLQLVERKYAKEIAQELRDALMPKGYRAAIEKEKISPVAVLDADEPKVQRGQPFAFSVTVEVAPDFDLTTYKGIRLTKRPVVVADEDVQREFDALLEADARFEEVTGRAVQTEDLVKVDYTGACDGQPIETLDPQAKGLGQRNDFWVSTGAYEFIPGFGAGLIGAAVGEHREVKVTFNAQFPVKALAGKDAVYQVDIKAIRGKILPPVDAEFLKKHGASTAEELRETLRTHLVDAREAMESRRLKDEIARHLGDSTPMDLPETQVQRETQSTIYDIVRENARRGVAEGEIAKNKDQIFQAANRSATESVKLRYILNRIADTENIQVGDDEFDAHLDAMAARYGMTPKDLRAGIDKRNAAGEMRESLRREKVLDFLLANAELS